MPKHRWKWRTERVRKLSPAALERLLWDQDVRVSGRLARWIYQNLVSEADLDRFGINALQRVAWDSDAPWARAFLWRELERHKASEFGDWVIVALAGQSIHASDTGRLIELYEDETAHLATRGSAIYGLVEAVQAAGWWRDYGMRSHPFDEETWKRVRATCASALCDEANPYARGGACWLASQLGGFDAELAILANDHTPVRPGEGLTVAMHCEQG